MVLFYAGFLAACCPWRQGMPAQDIAGSRTPRLKPPPPWGGGWGWGKPPDDAGRMSGLRTAAAVLLRRCPCGIHRHILKQRCIIRIHIPIDLERSLVQRQCGSLIADVVMIL